ncbi:MAG TPA: class I fructose-bisphosphate aldolase [Candidatus Eisenbacteria bacterium]|jgi:fructose-bisphosphate aldolase class I|nr:class I fructose-bisphosphate aldolase [Candidatus Eisenbacteria bacterium]
MSQQALESVAQAMVAKGKGILAADESMGTIKRRFDSIKIESNENNRRAYREMLFATHSVEEAISGVILFDETIRTAASDGTPFPQLLAKKGIIPGIKVDKGPVDIPGFPGEVVTEGLDGLRVRLKEYKELGAKFAKWRAVITIGDGIPTYTCLQVNAHALARYAALCQEAEIVPIVEPEVLLDGNHTIERSQEVTEKTLEITFTELFLQRVRLEGMILKPSMVVSGKDNPRQAGVEEVAERTIQCLKRTVPAAVPGIAFLSGGQSAVSATEHLNAMNKLGPHPWQVSFSYARALQDPALKAWKGEAGNVATAQRIFYHRAKMNSAARSGSYTQQMESAA